MVRGGDPLGSHLASLDLVAAGAADGAAIDSTVLGWVSAQRPELRERVRVVASWGPHPIQPVVARATLPGETVRAVAAALRTFDPRTGPAGELARFGIAGYVAGEPEPLPAEILRALSPR